MTIADPAFTVESNDLCDARFVWLNRGKLTPALDVQMKALEGVQEGAP
jgi:hypothetical protein